jgi:hypothetical protein
MALPVTRNTQPSPDHPGIRAHSETRPDKRGQSLPRDTSEVPTHRTCGPRTLAHLDAQPRRVTLATLC